MLKDEPITDRVFLFPWEQRRPSVFSLVSQESVSSSHENEKDPEWSKFKIEY